MNTRVSYLQTATTSFVNLIFQNVAHSNTQDTHLEKKNFKHFSQVFNPLVLELDI